MRRKKTRLIVTRLTVESNPTLESMVAELTAPTASRVGANAKPASWSRRFSASGKSAPAAKLHS